MNESGKNMNENEWKEIYSHVYTFAKFITMNTLIPCVEKGLIYFMLTVIGLLTYIYKCNGQWMARENEQW